MKTRVVVGMSGGVDSSVAAYLLKEQGYEPIGVTLQMWEDKSGACGGLTAAADAGSVADSLGIAHHIVNAQADFEEKVMDYFVREYARGYTPNPCNACNRHVKWKALMESAKMFHADFIATGHYARILRLDNGRYTVKNAITAAKDQTYALYALTQEQLMRTLMPLGDYEKEEVRALAGKLRLSVAHKRESQDICFVPDGDYAGFIARRTKETGAPGNFVDESGCVLGRHKGLVHYTVGQRRGLGISAETPLFVKELRVAENEVVLCRSESLFARECEVSDVNYMAVGRLTEPVPAVGKIRYSHAGAPCMLYPRENGALHCVFEEPQRAFTPGQAAVFYRAEEGADARNAYILCGGIIQK